MLNVLRKAMAEVSEIGKLYRLSDDWMIVWLTDWLQIFSGRLPSEMDVESSKATVFCEMPC